MRWKLAFGLASDDLFFVTTRPDRTGPSSIPTRSKITTFPDEDEFLGHLIRAGLRDDQTKAIALAVLLSVAKPVSPPLWTEVDLSRKQMELLRLSDPVSRTDGPGPFEGKEIYLQAARSGSLPQFYDLLMQAPTAVAMLVGPEHRYTLLNAKYVDLVGARSAARMLGRTVREVSTQIHGERGADILDKVYETGQPYVGTEIFRSFYRETSGRVEDGYFNSVYQPVCNAFGDVSGIMVQSTDVTEIVLERDVREQRERQLYRQWAELEAIYRSAPIAMMLVDAKDFRVQRVNERQAEMLGSTVADLLGRPLLETFNQTTRKTIQKPIHEPIQTVAEVRELLARVLAGESVTNHFMEEASSSEAPRCWLVSCAPTFSAQGQVDAIISVALEISRDTGVDFDRVALPELALMA